MDVFEGERSVSCIYPNYQGHVQGSKTSVLMPKGDTNDFPADIEFR